MSLTRQQLISLKSIRTFEENTPTFQYYLKRSLPYVFKTSGLLGLAAFLMYRLGWLMAAVFVCGIIFGTWLIILGNILTGIRIWSVLIRVIDWQKYDQLLEEETAQDF